MSRLRSAIRRAWLAASRWQRRAAAGVEAAVAGVQSLPSRGAGAARRRLRWLSPLSRWWATSPVRAAVAWWLEALDGCVERMHVRLPGWWPEGLTVALLGAALLAVDVAAWRWLPW